MKNLFFILTLASTFLVAKPCMTDIYTGNGINTTDKEAWQNMRALEIFMLYKARPTSRLDASKYNVDYSFNYIHNPDHGFNNDMMKTYYQLKETGQISDGFFHTMFSFLAGDIPENVLHAKYMEIVAVYEEDVNSIYWQYYNRSFFKKHNVLLVAHSQGNLIGNKIYTLLSQNEKKKFRMISVATPADHVAGGGPHVTAHADLVINNPLIPNHLPTNVAGTGHNFITTYLDAHSDARNFIAGYVKSTYDNLSQTSTCAQYEFTRVWMRSFGVLSVYGNVDGEDELVGEVTLEKSEAILDPNNNKYICEDENSFYWGDDNYSGQNWTYNYEDDRVNSWIPGQYITSRTYLDNVSSTKEVVRKDTQCITLTLEQKGDLYAMIYDMFLE